MNSQKLLHMFITVFSVFSFSCNLFAEEFNQSDKDATTSGNIFIAIKKLENTSPEDMNKSSQLMPVADVTKKIYTTIGKPIKIRGKVYKVEEMPPNSDLPGTWTEVLLMAKNQNAPMGAMTIDFLYKGDSAHINSKDIVTCSGYLVGTYESANAYGGKVEAIMLVGNHFKKEK